MIKQIWENANGGIELLDIQMLPVKYFQLCHMFEFSFQNKMLGNKLPMEKAFGLQPLIFLLLYV